MNEVGAPPSAPPAESYRAQVLEHRARRDARYASPEGWLTLIDRVALEPGENPLPLGTLVVAPDGAVTLRVAPGATVTRAGLPLSGEVAVAVDEPGSRPDVLEHDGRRYDLHRRHDRLSVRVRDPQAPALRAFRGIPFYPIDPAWRIQARLERIDPPRLEHVGHTDGSEGETRCVGIAHFGAAGADLTLAVYLEESTGRLFVPFADATGPDETYGGGRMLYVEPPAPGQPLVIDFNLAFNPPCAFNSLVSCPVPPPHNRLRVAIRAGEKRPDLPDPAA